MLMEAELGVWASSVERRWSMALPKSPKGDVPSVEAKNAENGEAEVWLSAPGVRLASEVVDAVSARCPSSSKRLDMAARLRCQGLSYSCGFDSRSIRSLCCLEIQMLMSILMNSVKYCCVVCWKTKKRGCWGRRRRDKEKRIEKSPIKKAQFPRKRQSNADLKGDETIAWLQGTQWQDAIAHHVVLW